MPNTLARRLHQIRLDRWDPSNNPRHLARWATLQKVEWAQHMMMTRWTSPLTIQNHQNHYGPAFICMHVHHPYPTLPMYAWGFWHPLSQPARWPASLPTRCWQWRYGACKLLRLIILPRYLLPCSPFLVRGLVEVTGVIWFALE